MNVPCIVSGEKKIAALKKRSSSYSLLAIIFGTSLLVALAASAAILFAFPAIINQRPPMIYPPKPPPILGINITIEAFPVNDTYSRFHALTVDVPPDTFWETSQNYVFDVNDVAFTHTTFANLTSGTHYVQYGVSTMDYLPWHARIYINNVLKAEGDVSRYNYLTAYFAV